MAWLAKLDARANRWPEIWQGLYALIKWSLAGLGGFCLIRMWLDRIGAWSLY